MPLTEWLRQLQQTQVEARQWEYCPLVKIKQWSEAPQTQALFESLLTFENRPTSSAPTLHSFSLAIENVHHVNQNHYPLTIIANPAGVLTLQAIYQTSRYDKETISGMLDHMVLALTDMIDASQVDVAKIGTPAPVRSGGPRKTKPKPIALNHERMVEKRFFNDQQTLPLILSPTVMDLDPVNWVVLNQDYLKSALQQYGAILFRNFGLRQVSDFERFSRAICPDLFSNYGDLPREGESGNIYQSTPYPADQAILFHNEGSHLDQWPLKQMFFCVTAADRGGETPLVDCRAIYRNLDSQVLRQFIEKKLIYLRNFIDGFDVGWREFFKTSEKAVVEDLCRRAKMDFEWKENGLRTRRLCQAVARHPETGEMSFFNQIQLHHVSCLDAKARDDILRLFREEDYPRHVSFGDGARIENSVIEMIRDLYQQTAVAFPWMKGDALLLDNMLVAHGRSPFSGERKIVVAMGEMVRADESAV
jgi:alpha-ketoglutarate-dependent taurine dioxygenase